MPDDLGKLAADLRQSKADARKQTRGVVVRGALEIKKAWKADAERWQQDGTAKSYPSSISYDDSRTVLGHEAEIGPDKDRKQGALGNLMEFGSNNNVPQNSGGRALRAEEPEFIRQMQKIADDLL